MARSLLHRSELNMCLRAVLAAVFFACAFGIRPAAGGDIDTASGVDIRWDTTLRLTSAWRTQNPDSELLSDINADDGNRNFRNGPVTQRVDVISELGLRRGNIGAEVSVAAWYDRAFDHGTDHNSFASFNPSSVSTGRLPRQALDLHRQKIELVSAYADASLVVADRPFDVRVGRQTVLWGESLFFAENGIAAGQSPLDVIKAISVPGSKAAEVYMPATQVWAGLQPFPLVSIEAYYQLEWRRSRLPGAGSFFSAADYLDQGGERLIVGPGQYFFRDADETPKAKGQFGIAVKMSAGFGDVGLYALRYHAREPIIHLRLGRFLGFPARSLPAARERVSLYGISPGAVVAGPGNPLRDFYDLYGDPNAGYVGDYSAAFPRGIELYGASFAGYVGDNIVAGEISIRHRTPLVSTPLLILPNRNVDVATSPFHPIGNTLHAQLSSSGFLPRSDLWDGAAWAVEVAGNHRLGVTRNETRFETTRSRDAIAVRAAFEPQYYAVLPGLDVSLPVSINYNIAGNSSVIASQTEHAGSFEVAVAATYRAVWTGAIKFTSFLGSASTQPLADRDIISITVSRTF